MLSLDRFLFILNFPRMVMLKAGGPIPPAFDLTHGGGGIATTPFLVTAFRGQRIALRLAAFICNRKVWKTINW